MSKKNRLLNERLATFENQYWNDLMVKNAALKAEKDHLVKMINFMTGNQGI
jgi:hypothetical protein